MTDLHLETYGDGTPAILVHGSFGTGLSAFSAQKPLSESHKLVIVDRRGFGSSPDGDELGWPVDADDIVALLDELGPAHLVGHSYGAVGCLLAASRWPDKTLSVVAIEPPAWGAAEDPQAAEIAEKSRAVAERAPELSVEDFVREWGATVGQSRFEVQAWTEGFAESQWSDAEASRRERWAGDAPIPYDELAAASFPKVFAHGGWNPEVVGHKASVGAAFRAVADTLSQRVGGVTVAFPDATHNPQSEAAADFNAMLQRTWDEAG